MRNTHLTEREKELNAEKRANTDMHLCFSCKYVCRTYETPDIITNRFGQVLKCDDYIPDPTPDDDNKELERHGKDTRKGW